MNKQAAIQQTQDEQAFGYWWESEGQYMSDIKTAAKIAWLNGMDREKHKANNWAQK